MNKIVIGIIAIVVLIFGAVFMFSGTNEDAKNVVSSTSTKTVESASKNFIKDTLHIPSAITARVIDQHGEVHGQNRIFISGINMSYAVIDAVGEVADFGYKVDVRNDVWDKTFEGYATRFPSKIKGGGVYDAIDGAYIITKTLNPGTYTLQIPYIKDEYNQENIERYCSCEIVTQTVEVTEDGVWLSDITVRRFPAVTVTIENEVGTPLKDGVFVQLTALEFLEQPNEKVVDLWEKLKNDTSGLRSWTNDLRYYATDYGFPSGSYTIKVYKDGYETAEKIFEVNDEDLEVKIILKKK
ncbi:hypothetical protein N8083_02315 [Candidatus Pacebacteria bacterium]|nr:hypothetical protein [Candidatus Paceibacterota bacterium]